MGNNTVVTTKSGKLEGKYEDDLYKFWGVPYAKPPVGNLRWIPPQPVDPWDGIRPAKQYGAMAPQVAMAAPSDSPGAPNFGNVPQSEDCLFLNIWTPGLDDAKRPVFFWIHGGGFIIGSGSESFMDKGVLAQRGDIVVVSINYRLGAAGFLNLDELTGGKIPSTGNEGILDQIAALNWVQENIAAFGGDPDNVTISGFSAGGMSVGTLLGFPSAKGLFHKALNRSGAANIYSTLEESIDITQKFLDVCGVKANDIDGLRNLTTEQIIDCQQGLANISREQGRGMLPFQPVVGGKTLPEKPMDAIRKGLSKDIITMAGTSRDELKSTSANDPSLKALDEAGLAARLSASIPTDMVQGMIQAYRRSMESGGSPVTPADIFSSINTDILFRIPTLRLLEAQRDNRARTYNYLFMHRSPAFGGALGAMHGLDNPFLFGALDAAFTGNGAKHQALAEKMQDSCIAFVRTGDPSCESAGEWPEYGKDGMTMLFDLDSKVEASPFKEEIKAWDGYTV